MKGAADLESVPGTRPLWIMVMPLTSCLRGVNQTVMSSPVPVPL
jgi:hypothetical protein